VPFIPVAGLHRFYVGKIGTGILWLFTWGLAGIGQFIDIILILTGNFKDKGNLPVLNWKKSIATSAASPAAAAVVPTPPAAAEPKAEPAVSQQVDGASTPEPVSDRVPSWPSYASTGSIIYPSWDPIGGLLCAFGHALALVAILVGLAIGLHVPSIVASGWPDPEIAEKLYEVFGYSNWPVLLEKLGFVLTFVLLFLAATFIMMGRRRSGAAHLLRAVIPQYRRATPAKPGGHGSGETARGPKPGRDGLRRGCFPGVRARAGLAAASPNTCSCTDAQ
jgi:hypothetical protein